MLHECSSQHKYNPLQASDQQQYNEDDYHQAQATAGAVTPIPAVRPDWNNTDQHQDQQNQNDSSQTHDLLLRFVIELIISLA